MTGFHPGTSPDRYAKDQRFMKVIDTPRTNRIGNLVAYISPFGQCYRTYSLPRNPNSEAQRRMRDILGSTSSGWGRRLTEAQRERWVAAALQVPSHPTLGQYSHLSGQQLCIKINSTLRCIGHATVDEPPAPVVFTPNPVGDLAIVNDPDDGVRLLLNVGTVAEEVMVFGQAPCSAGRMKHRRVCYLGLLGPATNGQCDITGLYTARLGQPSPGKKVFIVTCQEKHGWKAQDNVTCAIVPPRPLPAGPEADRAPKPAKAAQPEAPEGQSAPTERAPSLSCAVYKRSTPAAPELPKDQADLHPVSIPGTPLVHAVGMALTRLGQLMFPGMRVWRAFATSLSAVGG
jgi:hypothetical protein